MQAVILAAGKSTRTYPLTLTRPKPLLKVANQTILGHNLGNLAGFADEAVLVVGYKKEMIKKHFGDKYKNIKLKYIEQKEQLGTAHALSAAEHCIKGKFVLMMGDDIYSEGDIKNCIKHQYSILTAIVKDPQNFGVITEKNGILKDFVEKPKTFVSNLANAAFYCLDKKIFKCLKQIKKSERNEFELPDAIKLLSKDGKMHCIKAKQWLPIAYPWDLLKADKILRKSKNIIGKNSKIYGKVENSSVGNSCKIKGTVKNSIIMDNSVIDKNSIVEDSVIGENVYFSGKIKSKNNAASIVNGKEIKIDKFGAVIGDNVKARHMVINAGCKIWPNKIISNKTIIKDLI